MTVWQHYVQRLLKTDNLKPQNLWRGVIRPEMHGVLWFLVVKKTWYRKYWIRVSNSPSKKKTHTCVFHLTSLAFHKTPQRSCPVIRWSGNLRIIANVGLYDSGMNLWMAVNYGKSFVIHYLLGIQESNVCMKFTKGESTNHPVQFFNFTAPGRLVFCKSLGWLWK